MTRCICFDLGGVMVQIARDWSEALVKTGLPPTPALGQFDSLPAFVDYQNGALSDTAYLEALSKAFEIPIETASRLHQNILSQEHEGIADAVAQIEDNGFITGCLSNTNALHWAHLTDPTIFPSVARLQTKVASHEVQQCKPDIAIYHTFETMSRCSGTDILFFDDSDANVDAAKRMGWTAFQIDPNDNPGGTLTRHLVHYGVI